MPTSKGENQSSMDAKTLPNSWPYKETKENIEKQLRFNKTGIFVDKAKGRPLRFCMDSFPYSQQIAKAVQRNGGVHIKSSDYKAADILFTTQLCVGTGLRPKGMPICHARYVVDSLHAGRMLSFKDYDPDRFTEKEDGEPNGNAYSSQQQMLSLALSNSNTTQAQHLHSADELLDADDMLVNNILSSQSRSLTEYPQRQAGSPDSHSTHSAAISDNDARIKAFLNANARDFASSFNTSPAIHPTQRPINTSAGPISVNGRRPVLTTQPEQHASAATSGRRTSRTPIRKSNSSGAAAAPPRRTELISSASKSFIDARNKFELSPPVPADRASFDVQPSNRKQTENADRSAQVQSPPPLHKIATQASVTGDWGDIDLSAPSSPELCMPVSEAPMNSAYEFIGYTDGSASRLNSQKASQGDVDEKKVDELYEADLNSSDDEYPDPQQFLADRSTQPEKKPATSKIDEKISPPPPKANGSSSNSANANAGFDLATANPSTHDDTDGQGVSKAPSVGSPPVRTESASPWEGLGKRRRAAGHNSEYDQRPVPVIVGQSNRSLTSTREQPEQIRTPSPAGEKQAPSHTSDMTTPAKGKGRLKIRVKPFSATKKIRMSASESPVRKELDSSEQISKSPYKAVLPDNRNDHGTGAKAHEDSSDGVGDARPLDSRPSSSPVMLAPPTFSLPEASSSAPLPSSIPTSNPISHVSESSPATQPKTTEADLVSDIDIPSPKSTPDPRSSPQRSQDSTSGKEQESESDTRSSGSELSTQGKRHTRRSTRLKRKSPEPSTKAPPSQPTRSRMARRSGGRPAARPAAVKQRTTQSWVSTARAAKETAKARIAKAAMPTIEPDTSSYESSATDNTQETAEQPLVSDGYGNGDLAAEQDKDQSESEASEASTEPRSAPASRTASRSGLGLGTSLDQSARSISRHGSKESSYLAEETWRPATDVFGSEDEDDGDIAPAASINRSPSRANNKNLMLGIVRAGSSTQPLPGRQHRVSSQRRVSMCQRLLQLHQAQENSVGLGIQLTPDVLKTSSLLDPDALQNIRTPTTRSPPSPSRRATLSGTMRVFGDWEPSINDKDRLLYMRRLKGLMEGTRLAAREALRVLYFCTGDWVSARRFITAGPSAMPPGRMWTAKEDEVLLKGMNPETMEHLRETKGSTEVYRRLQFLNTFHGIQPQ